MLSIQETYKAVVRGMSAASRDPAFGRRMLRGGKTKTNIGRERWLCGRIAKALQATLERTGWRVIPEAGGRIDIAIVSHKDGRPLYVIEAKFLFCHDCYQRGTGHKFLNNVREDIKKRSQLGLQHLEIVLAANYESMCSNGKKLGLYAADAINRHLAKHRHRSRTERLDCCGFSRFERDLFGKFGGNCEIFPRRGKHTPHHTWHAKYRGASESIRVWVLGVGPGNSN